VDSDILEAVEGLLALLIRSFGPDGTLILLGVAVLLFVGWRIYLRRSNTELIDKLLAEKERTIQRIAGEARQYKLLYLISTGMDRREAERIILLNDYSTPTESRQALEEPREPRSDAEPS
jgi:hypothetical protein